MQGVRIEPVSVAGCRGQELQAHNRYGDDMVRVALIPFGAFCLYLLLLLALDLIGVKRWHRGWGFRLRNVALLLICTAALISYFRPRFGARTCCPGAFHFRNC